MSLSYEERKAKLALILGWPGLGAAKTHPIEVREHVAQILTPHDDLQVALASLPGMSNCNMTQLGFMRVVGVEHSILDQPYFRPGGGMRVATVDLQTIAKDLDAWCTPATTDVFFEPGDMPLIGGSGYEPHGSIVVDHDISTGVVTSIDGGQGNHGAEIAWRKRRFAQDHDGRWWTWEGTDEDGYRTRGRPLIGWVDLGKLFP